VKVKYFKFIAVHKYNAILVYSDVKGQAKHVHYIMNINPQSVTC
jgi:hypothetical protein